jgi:hypothetical protein
MERFQAANIFNWHRFYCGNLLALEMTNDTATFRDGVNAVNMNTTNFKATGILDIPNNSVNFSKLLTKTSMLKSLNPKIYF